MSLLSIPETVENNAAPKSNLDLQHSNEQESSIVNIPPSYICA
jgi:hypothetical protein